MFFGWSFLSGASNVCLIALLGLLLWHVSGKLIEPTSLLVVPVCVKVDAVRFWFDSIEHAKRHIEVGNIIPGEIHEVRHQDATDGAVSDEEDVVLDALELSDHVSQAADDLEVALASNAGIDVVELVFGPLCKFLGILLLDLLIGQALERAGVELVKHLPVLDVVIVVLVKVLGCLDASLEHGRPDAEILRLELAQKLGVRRGVVSWLWGERRALHGSQLLVLLPLLALVADEVVEDGAVIASIRGEVGVPTNLAEDVVDRFAVPGDPDLPGRQIEGREVGCDAAGEKALQLMVDHLLADIDHLDVLHVVVLFVLSDRDVCVLVGLDTLLEVKIGFLRVLALVIRTPQLQAHVDLEKLGLVSYRSPT